MSDFYSLLKSVSASVPLRACTFLFGSILLSYNNCRLCSELSKCVEIMVFGIVFITKTKKSHFSHPFQGTYEVIQFLELGNLSGTPFQEWYDLHNNSIIPWYGNLIPFHVIPYHSMSYHTIPYHTMPYHHTIPYCTIIPNLSQGVWGPFSKM